MGGGGSLASRPRANGQVRSTAQLIVLKNPSLQQLERLAFCCDYGHHKCEKQDALAPKPTAAARGDCGNAEQWTQHTPFPRLRGRHCSPLLEGTVGASRGPGTHTRAFPCWFLFSSNTMTGKSPDAADRHKVWQ